MFFCHQSILMSRSSNFFDGLVSPMVLEAGAEIFGNPTNGQNLQTSLSGLAMSPIAMLELPTQDGDSVPTPPTLLPQNRRSTVLVPETSTVFNVVLHMVYAIVVEEYAPDIDTIALAISTLPKYGIPVPKATQTDVWALLLKQAHTPGNAIKVYAIAAANGIDSVCVLASQYTLGVSLSTLTEADALTIGAVYLRRLVFLHVGRREALVRVIIHPPSRHGNTAECFSKHQDEVARNWSIAFSHLVSGTGRGSEASLLHDTSVGALADTFGPVALSTRCEICKGAVRTRVSDLVRAWLAIRRTI